jgi:flagellar motor protein MotB
MKKSLLFTNLLLSINFISIDSPLIASESPSEVQKASSLISPTALRNPKELRQDREGKEKEYKKFQAKLASSKIQELQYIGNAQELTEAQHRVEKAPYTFQGKVHLIHSDPSLETERIKNELEYNDKIAQALKDKNTKNAEIGKKLETHINSYPTHLKQIHSITTSSSAPKQEIDTNK